MLGNGISALSRVAIHLRAALDELKDQLREQTKVDLRAELNNGFSLEILLLKVKKNVCIEKHSPMEKGAKGGRR